MSNITPVTPRNPDRDMAINGITRIFQENGMSRTDYLNQLEYLGLHGRLNIDADGITSFSGHDDLEKGRPVNITLGSIPVVV
jgi:hypothetical protein